jgi:glycosyltransferase involved in cell wall biosynthesis
MNVQYLVTDLPTRTPERVAHMQEISALRRCIGGELLGLNPNARSPIRLPRLLFGFHKVRALRAREANIDLYHVYNADAYPYPVLRLLRRPIVYSIGGGVGTKRPNLRFFDGLAAVVVADERSRHQLEAWGVQDVTLVRTGIDTSRFTVSPLPLKSEIRLLVGSAPWTLAQFATKGVEALLAAAQRDRHLRLTFLWRGVLEEEMLRRVRQMNLSSRVTVLNRHVDVNEILSGVHASITLASAPDIVKSYPHSLLESLAAGKPVLVSRAIPMAHYVERTGCGIIIPSVTSEEVLTAVGSLTEQYAAMQRVAQAVGKQDFPQEKMIQSFQGLYERVIEAGDPVG